MMPRVKSMSGTSSPSNSPMRIPVSAATRQHRVVNLTTLKPTTENAAHCPDNALDRAGRQVGQLADPLVHLGRRDAVHRCLAPLRKQVLPYVASERLPRRRFLAHEEVLLPPLDALGEAVCRGDYVPRGVDPRCFNYPPQLAPGFTARHFPNEAEHDGSLDSLHRAGHVLKPSAAIGSVSH